MGELLVGGVTRVVIGRDTLDAARILGDTRPESSVVVAAPGPAGAIAAAVVARLDAAGVRTALVEVPDAPAAKSLATVDEVCRAIADHGFTRDDLIIGVGGGTVTDLAGFVAAVFLRGVRVHFVPTTLLAAVDAAVGGKSGVDVAGKNLVGSFRHPERVLIDLQVLEGLPPGLLRQGMAEALKAGLVGDPTLVGLLETSGIEADLEQVVTRSLTVKGRIVGADFTEQGERAHLNYGHTIGHALESVLGIPHGDAVAIGMIAAGRASALDAGFDAEERQRQAIAGLGLPVMAPPVDRAAVLDQMRLDKKRRGTGTTMVLLESIGHPRVAAVDSATVDAALTAAGIPGGAR